MRFDVLGPVRVRHGTVEVPVPGLLRQRLLGLLLAHANTPVSAEWLSTALWGGESERRGGSKLHLLVHRLRKTLGEPERLVSDAGGYLLQVEPDELDSERFETLLDLAERNFDPQRRADLLRQALRLWRGTPYQDLDLAELAGEAQRIEERRLAGLEQLHAAELDCGRHSFIIAELSDLVRENPLRERLHALLMTALYRAGRQADALAVYRRARRTMVDELGLEPGPALRDLEQRILAGEHIEFEPPTARPPARPAQLPHDVPGFIGRDAELTELDRLSEKAEVPIAVVAGTAGVGKSALVTHWAHAARERFPDGQLYVDLRGYGPDQPLTTTEVLAGFLRALGIPGDAIPADATERAARFRTVVDQRRMLIVLDNAAAPGQIRPLLPGTPTSFVVVTSRDSLSGLTARDGAYRLVLDRMDPGEAHALLTDRLGEDVLNAGTAKPLIERCARLPLALRVAAERLHQSGSRDVSDLLEELTDEQRGLDALDTGDEHTSVRAVFSWSYRNLPDDAARLFRLYGFTCRHAGHRIGVFALTALLGCDDVQTTRRLLDVLVRAHLLTEVSYGRYEMHALLGDYAAELAELEQDRPAIVARLLGFYLHTADQAMRILHPERDPDAGGLPRPVAMPTLSNQESAVKWLDTERPNLMCAAESAAKAGMQDLVTVLFRMLHGYFADGDRYYDDAQRLAALAGGAIPDDC
ncbi:AfsR/SARP family transcriptional regulator [Saccharopolyspora flava]|uniref:DNA-binding transcriptional activator of the SARP family n=1 Tax=Saccharopolyspora flava TaxID=95161 RepID=A0A1I6QK48_9PSEU|nr:BTAD domain-containing putative transcriptional regulator [Saccharopolyspora flava]SFS52722.1 DNA-binding transcriptional activator of the SARP family [Saccharopolyspora flava]